MQINHDLQTRALGPVQRLTQFLICALHKRLAVNRNHTPVPDGNAHVIESCAGDLAEVVLCDEGIPMLGQDALGLISSKDLGKCELVHGRVSLELAWSDPWLEDKPAAEIDSTDFLVVVELEVLAFLEVTRERGG